MVDEAAGAAGLRVVLQRGRALRSAEIKLASLASAALERFNGAAL